MNLCDLKNKKGQNICFLNVHSLYNNFSEIELDFKLCKFVALCFSETWLNNTFSDDLIKLDGFKL